jgi:hypothetical protein
VDFSSPIFFVVFVCCQFWWGHCPWIVFSQIYFTFFMIYYASRLRFYDILRLSSTFLWYTTPLVYVFMIYYASRLRFYDILRLSSTFLWTFLFNAVFCVCSLLILFSLSTRCQYYMNYWTHTPFNCWQNRPD